MRHAGRFQAAAVLLFAVVLQWRLQAQPASAIRLERSEVRLAAVVRGDAVGPTTPDQVVLVDTNGRENVPFTASSNEPWLIVTPASGVAPGRLLVHIDGAGLGGRGPAPTGEIAVVAGSDGSTTQRLRTTVTIIEGTSRPPFGFVDTADDLTSDRPFLLVGWALDDVAVTEVAICRAAATDEISPPGCREGTRAFLGSAPFAYGSRPDVANAYPHEPLNFRAGWSYFIDPKTASRSVGPTFQLFAVAHDGEGHATLLGKRMVRAPATVPAPSWRKAGAVAAILLAMGLVHTWLFVAMRSGTSTPSAPRPLSLLPRPSWWESLTTAGAVGAFLTFSVPAMTKGLQYDELYSASHFIVSRPLLETATGVGVFNNHVAYSLLAGAAVRLAGSAEWVLRLPSVICGIVAIVLVPRLARLTINSTLAVLAAPILALSPLFVAWARMARGYAGLTLMCLVSTYCFFVLLRRPSRKVAWSHGAANVVAVYFHLYGLWTVAVQYLLMAWLILKSRRESANGMPDADEGALRLLWISLSATALTLALLYLPLIDRLLKVVTGRGRTPFRMEFGGELYHSLVGTDSTALGVVFVSTIVLGLVRLGRRIEMLYFTVLLALPVIVSWILVRPFDLYVRFFVFLVPIVACLSAAGISVLVNETRRGRGAWPRLVGGGVCLAGVVAIALLAADWVRQDLAKPSDGYGGLLRPAAQEGGAVRFAFGADSEMFQYYFSDPLRQLRDESDLDAAIHEPSRLQVLYHNVSWNSPEQKRMAERLKGRCHIDDRGLVVAFLCDF